MEGRGKGEEVRNFKILRWRRKKNNDDTTERQIDIVVQGANSRVR